MLTLSVRYGALVARLMDMLQSSQPRMPRVTVVNISREDYLSCVQNQVAACKGDPNAPVVRAMVSYQMTGDFDALVKEVGQVSVAGVPTLVTV